MGPEQEKLMARLFDDPNRRTRNFHISPGTRRATAEEICGQINSALDQIARGEGSTGPAWRFNSSLVHQTTEQTK